MGKMYLVWVEIEDVLPNPLNPRKNFGVKTEEMQRIIKEKGWETGITCYKKDSKYVVLSGHRRWYAANELKIKLLPIVVVEPPKSEAEELERLGSAQGGKVDWSDYEWAKYTYEMWGIWDKCSFAELASKMGISTTRVSTRIKIFQYYPHIEIEDKLAKGIYSLSGLFYLIKWMEHLNKAKPSLVNQFKDEMIRKTMLRKIEMKLVNVNDLKNDKFIDLANDEHLKNFLMDSKKSLSQALKDISAEDSKYRNTSKVSTQVKKIQNRVLIINQVDSENPKDAEILKKNLMKLREVIIQKQEDLKSHSSI